MYHFTRALQPWTSRHSTVSPLSAPRVDRHCVWHHAVRKLVTEWGQAQRVQVMNDANTGMALWKTLGRYCNQTLNNTDMMLSYHISHLNIYISIYLKSPKKKVLMLLYHQHWFKTIHIVFDWSLIFEMEVTSLIRTALVGPCTVKGSCNLIIIKVIVLNYEGAEDIF